jgi:hypothetical protein
MSWSFVSQGCVIIDPMAPRCPYRAEWPSEIIDNDVKGMTRMHLETLQCTVKYPGERIAVKQFDQRAVILQRDLQGQKASLHTHLNHPSPLRIPGEVRISDDRTYFQREEVYSN